MQEVRGELHEALEQKEALMNDLAIVQKEMEKMNELEQCVEQLTKECSNAKDI